MIRLTVGRNGNVKKQQLKPQSEVKKPVQKEPLAAIPQSIQPNKPQRKVEIVEEYSECMDDHVYECKTPRLAAIKLHSRIPSIRTPQIITPIREEFEVLPKLQPVLEQTVQPRSQNKSVIRVNGLLNYNPILIEPHPVPIHQLLHAFTELIDKNDATEDKDEHDLTLENAFALLKGYLKIVITLSLVVTRQINKSTPHFSSQSSFALHLLTELINHCSEREDLTARILALARSIQEENIILKEVISNHADQSTDIHVHVIIQQAPLQPQYKPLCVDKESITVETKNASFKSESNSDLIASSSALNGIKGNSLFIVEPVEIKEFVDESMQTTPVVDDMPLRYRNKAEELHKELEALKSVQEKDAEASEAKHSIEIKKWEAQVKSLETTMRKSEDENHIKHYTSTRQIKEIQHHCLTVESSRQSLEDQIKLQRSLLHEKEELLQTAHTEKMETFKQFRALNRLYDDLKESSESIETKRNHLIHHSKELENKCGIFEVEGRVMGEKLRAACDELGVAKRAFEEMRLEKTKLAIDGNNYQEIEYTRTLLEAQKHKVKTAQETIESLMRFPDTSLGEDDNQISLVSQKFDQLVQEFVKGNNLRILVLETKNEEYRNLRIQHAELYAKNNLQIEPAQQELPQLLFSPVNISDTLAMIEDPQPTSRRDSDVAEAQLTSLDRVNSYSDDLYTTPIGSNGMIASDVSQDSNVDTPEPMFIGARRSSMSGGRRGSGASKNVSWHNDDF